MKYSLCFLKLSGIAVVAAGAKNKAVSEGGQSTNLGLWWSLVPFVTSQSVSRQLVLMDGTACSQRAPSWKTRGPSGSGSRSPCYATTCLWPATLSAPRRRSTRWRSSASCWHSRSTDSWMTPGETSPRLRRAVSSALSLCIVTLVNRNPMVTHADSAS